MSTADMPPTAKGGMALPILMYHSIDGTGSVVSATRVHHRFHDVAPPLPYEVVVVELDEGPRLFGLMDHDDADDVVGRRVELRGPFEVYGPWFDPIDAGSTTR